MQILYKIFKSLCFVIFCWMFEMYRFKIIAELGLKYIK